MDNEISANIIMLDTHIHMGLSEGDMFKKFMVLVSFSGEAKNTIGEISLPLYVQGINLQVKFLVIEGVSAYNIILGRP